MRPAGRFCSNCPEPFGNCPARDLFRKSQAAEASPDIPAAYPQKRQSERSMNLRMSEGLQLKSRGFLSKAAQAESAPPEIPAIDLDRLQKRQNSGTPDPSWLWIARYSAKF